MKMKAVWSEESTAHDPHGEVWIGVRIQGDETPERGPALRRAIDRAGLEVIVPDQHDDPVITAVHDAGMLEYLRTAYDEWVAAGYPQDPGQDRVVAYAFRHPGAFGHVADRLPRSRTAMAGVYCMDTCTVLGPGSFRGIRYAVDAAVTAADIVAAGAANAYAAVRPPGHHAGTDYFGGSCYLNNAAIAAQRMVDRTSGRVGIIDVDAHHGNGTQQIFYDRDDVVYASVHVDPGKGWFPHWCGFEDEQGSGRGLGYNQNHTREPGAGDAEFTLAVSRAAERVADRGCELLVVSLGVDAGGNDPESPLNVSNSGFAEAAGILSGLGLPTVLIQEGGYRLEDLEDDVAAILARFSNTGGGVDER
jgi:acetoin utilization deacetylase AcuC-like enzyme